MTHAEKATHILARDIARWAEWDGTKILEVAAAALEDANYYKEAAIVEAVRDLVLRETSEDTTTIHPSHGIIYGVKPADSNSNKSAIYGS